MRFKQCNSLVTRESGDRRLRFTISTGSVDRDNDTIDPAGWELDAYRANPVVLWAHDHRALPVARALEVGVTSGRLMAVAEFASHQFAQTVFELYRDGFMRATSVGFRALEHERNAHGGVRFKRQELLEFSCVPVPANAEALVAASGKGIAVEHVKNWAREVLDSPLDRLRGDDILDLTDALRELAPRGHYSARSGSPIGAEYLDVSATDVVLAVRSALREGFREVASDAVRRELNRIRGRLD